MATGKGTDSVDFGATPGTNIVTKTVAAVGLTSSGYAEAFIQGNDSTATHNTYEHQTVLGKEVSLVCTPGTDQFVVTATTYLRLDGTMSFHFAWST